MIKKIFLTLLISLLTISTALADRIPSNSKSIRNYGIGLLKIDEDFDVYIKPDEKSRIIRRIIIPSANNRTAIVQESKKTVNPFVVCIPSKKEYFAAIYEYPEKNWIQIYYNQNGKETGWVKLPDKKSFLTWKEFVFKYGKKNGLVLMKDVPAKEFKLHSQDSESAQIVDEFTYPEYIALRMIRGNWALVTVVDTGTVYKTGWFKWRTDDGKLRVFPKMK